jgi:hypothetical protein
LHDFGTCPRRSRIVAAAPSAQNNSPSKAYPVTDDGKQYLKPTSKWAADVRFADGRRKRVQFSANLDAAAVMLADLLKKIENEKAGIRDDYSDHRRVDLADLFVEYQQHIADKGATSKEARQAARRCEIAFGAVGFVHLADLDAAPIERWLADRRRLPKAEGTGSSRNRKCASTNGD